MEISYNNFIGIYDNVYPEGYCGHLIEEFDRLKFEGAGSNRLKSENAPLTIKNDHFIFFDLSGSSMMAFNEQSPKKIFFDGLQKCYDNYVERFPSLKDGKIRSSSMKAQCTPPGGGYHIWHCEQGNDEQSNRVLVYMLYLNTLETESAGETEFIFQQERYQPIQNRLIIWPAAFTHTHRGNTVFGEKSKYVITGWFYYA